MAKAGKSFRDFTRPHFVEVTKTFRIDIDELHQWEVAGDYIWEKFSEVLGDQFKEMLAEAKAQQPFGEWVGWGRCGGFGCWHAFENRERSLCGAVSMKQVGNRLWNPPSHLPEWLWCMTCIGCYQRATPGPSFDRGDLVGPSMPQAWEHDAHDLVEGELGAVRGTSQWRAAMWICRPGSPPPRGRLLRSIWDRVNLPRDI